MASLTQNPAYEDPLYIETFHQHRRHWYEAVQGDAFHRHPIRLTEIWNEYDEIPDVPDPSLLNDNDVDAGNNVALRKLRELTQAPDTFKFQLAAGPPGLVCAITATWGQAAPIAGNVLPVLQTPPQPATGYTPVITDAKGVNHPMLASEWVVDFCNGYIEFPNGIPANPDGSTKYPQPLYFTWFQYVGAFGGAGMGPGAHPWIVTADSSGQTIHRDPVFGVGAGTDLAWPTLTTEGVGSRFMFDVSQAAFRAGYVSGTQWDVASRGLYSAAFGLDSVANATASAVSGGTGNTASGIAAAVPGGSGNTASGINSLAAGTGSAAAHAGALVWSDSTVPRASTAPDEATFGATGGFRVFGAGASSTPAYVGGEVYLDAALTVVTGKLTVTGIIDPTGLVCTEQSAVPEGPPGPGFGTLWVRDDAPNVPMFTDGAGADHVIAYLDSVTLADAGVGGGESLVNDGLGPTLATKGLVAGTGVSLSSDATDVTVTATGDNITLSTAGAAVGTQSLVNDGVGPDLATKGLAPGTGISLSNDAFDVTITATGTNITLQNGGLAVGNESLVQDGVGPDLATKGIVAGAGITLSSNSTDLTIGTNISLQNGGVAVGNATLVQDGTGPVLATKGLVAGTAISFSTTGTDVTINATGSNVSLQNAGLAVGNETLVNDGTGPVLQTKALVAGTGVSLSSNSTDITINATGGNVSLSNGGLAVGNETLVQDGAGPGLATKGVVAGTGISLSSTGTDLTIAATGANITLSSAGGTETLVADGTGPSLQTKGLTAGTGITLSSNASAVTINAPGTNVSLSNGGLAVGNETLVQDGAGPALATKGIVAGSGITLSSTGTDLTISASLSTTSVVAITGVITRVPDNPTAIRYAAFGSSDTSSQDPKRFYLPYNSMVLLAFSVTYQHYDSPLNVPFGAEVEFLVGTISGDTRTGIAVFNSFPSTSVKWTPIDLGGYPSKAVFPNQLMNTIEPIAVQSTESAIAVSPDDCWATVTLVIRIFDL